MKLMITPKKNIKFITVKTQVLIKKITMLFNNKPKQLNK